MHQLTHHFVSLIANFLHLESLERNFSWTCFNNNNTFFHLSPISSHLHPLQVENCDSNMRLVVDKDDNGKFRLQRVKGLLRLIGLRPPFKDEEV